MPGKRLDGPLVLIESSKILGPLYEHFDVLELSAHGGTLIHLVQSGIAHKFVDGDPEADRIFDLCFRAEDACWIAVSSAAILSLLFADLVGPLQRNVRGASELSTRGGDREEAAGSTPRDIGRTLASS